MFNPDGSHRPDADIAVDADRVIAQMIKDGVMKAQNAPATPIKGFEDANKYVNNYPTVEVAPAAPSAAAAPGSKPAACPPDRPWLCPSTPLASSASDQPDNARLPVAQAASEAPVPASPQKTPATKPQAEPTIQKPAAPPAAPKSKNNSAALSADKSAAAAKPDPKGESSMYVFGPNDVIGVSVFDERNVSGTYSIGPDGYISMPLIHTFKAVGYTNPELTEIIAGKLREDGGILEPIVNIQLLRSNSKQYTILGAVGRGGPVPLLRETTILDALALAGFREFAGKKKITLRRGTKDYHFNYNEVSKGKHMEQNIVIQDGDYIYVPGD